MSRTFIIAALAAVVSFSLMAIIPTEQKTSSAAPLSIQIDRTEINL